MEQDDPTPRGTGDAGRWDRVAGELAALRRTAGDPSFTEIADRVAAARREAGTDTGASRVARSTVYDCFRTGRARMNLALVREIVVALGGDPAAVDTWLTTTPAAPALAEVPEHVTPPQRPAALIAAPALSVPSVWAAAATCVLFNLLGRVVVDVLDLPVYLDMVGTAIAAIALGPWVGAGVGLSTNLLGVLTSSWVSLPFAVVNIAGALAWGYGVRRLGLGRTLPRFFGLNLAVAVLCSLVAVPILVLLFGGSVGQGQDSITATFRELGNGLLLAVGFSNLLTSIADKLISGFVALVVVAALPRLLGGPDIFPFLTPPPGPPGGRSGPTPGPATGSLT